MDDFPPELATFLVTLGILEMQDIVNLSFTSKRMLDTVIGNNWCASHVMALKGLKWCCKWGTTLSVKLCLKDPDCNFEEHFLYCLLLASEGNMNNLELLLKDDRVDPEIRDCWLLALEVEFHPGVIQKKLAESLDEPSLEHSCGFLYEAMREFEFFRKPKNEQGAKEFPKFLYVACLGKRACIPLSTQAKLRKIYHLNKKVSMNSVY